MTTPAAVVPHAAARPAADRRGVVLWSMTCVLLAGGALAAQGRPADAIDWQPGRVWPEVWRCWSAAWVHYSDHHLLANLVGTALVAAFGVACRLPLRLALAWLLAWPATHLVLLSQPALLHYGGLSGVLHAGVAIAAFGLLREPLRPLRRLGLAVLLGLALKLVTEAPWRGPIAHPPGWDIATAPGAHLAGALCGLLAAWALAERPRTR